MKNKIVKTAKNRKLSKEEKHKRKLQIIWGIFISMIFIVGSLSYLAMDTNTNNLNSFEFNGYTFQYLQNQITTTINDATLKFFITPFDAQKFNISIQSLIEISNAKKVTISVDPDSKYISTIGMASFYLQTDFLSIGKNAEFAAIKENSINYSIVTCKNGSNENFVIEMIDGNETKIERDSNCLRLISNQPYGHLILRDALAYRLYGIVKD